MALTDKSGAVRGYEAKQTRFSKWDRGRTAVDSNDITWQLTESKLVSSDGQILYRLPAHRAFWFGWYSAYSHTKLIK